SIEKPRDLQVSQEITQLTPLEGSIEKTGDILLLERPDYTVFDEIRISSDFTTYSDLRLAGVGMLGVIHASRAIDAMQRFVGKIELGLIPQVIDTIIYIESGVIKDVLDLTYSVKIPSGMSEEDLARPIIEIKDFFTGIVLYEIYTFGEQVVVVPVKKKQKRDMKALVNHIESELHEIPHKIDVDDTGRLKLYVPEQYMGETIGKGGGRVKGLEQDIGMPIDIEEMNFKAKESLGTEVTANRINLHVGNDLKDKDVEVLVEDSPLFIARVSKNGIIQVKAKSVQGRALRKAISQGQKIRYSII
ncbi:MAG: ATPase, partial [Candidatus Thermoplasmatota archaeon]|nr:ATPase [Candidatus Thermoplasmatota archaeon]